MTRWGAVEYTSVRGLRGPLMVVQGVHGVGWDEYVTLQLADGQQRHGVVLEADRDLAIVQVLEGTTGISPQRARVRFSGAPLQVPVGQAWLGRVCNGRGAPLDGGPPVRGARLAPRPVRR